MSLTSTLATRAAGACELCGADDDLGAVVVPPRSGDDGSVVACAGCRAAMAAQPLDANRFAGLRDAVWKDVPAVQVLAVRLLRRLTGASWAADLLDQVYLDEDAQAWADAAVEEGADAPVRTVDSHGAALADGDAVTLIKDLDVKGAGFTAKRGTVVKGIRLTDDPGLVEGRVNGIGIVLKTEFLKRVG